MPVATGVHDQPDILRLLFEHHPDPMWIYDLQTLRFLDVNHAAVERYGYSRQEFAAMTIRQIRPTHELDRLDTNLSQPRPDLARSGVWEHSRRDGTPLLVEITSHTLTYNGHSAALVVARDVSQQVQADRRHDQLLRESEAVRHELEVQARNFDAMFEQMADPVMIFDAHGRIDRMNKAARALFASDGRVAPGTISSRDLAERFRMRDEHGVQIPHDALPVMRVLRGELLTGANALDAQVGSRAKPIFLSITGSAIRDRSGEIIGAVMISRDVTDRRRLEQQAQEGLRQLNRRMEAFLSLAGHEMRTPLTSILGNIQLAARSVGELESASDATAVQLQRLRLLVLRMERQARVLSSLVNDVLDASISDSHELALDHARFDVLEVVDEVVLDARASMRGRSIELQVPEGGPLIVEGDRERISQVISHFLANAHKFSPLSAPVDVEVNRDAASVAVSVSDHGPGVRASERERIWERFYRVDGLSHVSGSSVGLGLGLYLGRTIVERHGGSVGLDDSSSGGARFWFRLPLTRLAADAPTEDRIRTGDLTRR